MLSYKKDKKLLVSKAMEVVADLTREKVPEDGIFQSISVIFDYPSTPVTGRLMVEKSYQQTNSRRITAGMYRKGDDRLVSNYLYVGTKQEILAWLSAQENISHLIDTYEHLAEKAKDFDA